MHLSGRRKRRAASGGDGDGKQWARRTAFKQDNKSTLAVLPGGEKGRPVLSCLAPSLILLSLVLPCLSVLSCLVSVLSCHVSFPLILYCLAPVCVSVCVSVSVHACRRISNASKLASCV